jgi:hypothetical protein
MGHNSHMAASDNLGKQFNEPRSIFKIRHAGHYFLTDHIDRMGEETGLSQSHIQGSDKNHVHVNMTDNQASSLLGDAHYYAHGSDWSSDTGDLRRSAKSVISSLGKYFE